MVDRRGHPAAANPAEPRSGADPGGCPSVGRCGTIRGMMGVDATANASERIPKTVWVAAFLLAALRSLPFWWALGRTPEGGVGLPISYIPQDWLAYTGLIHHASEGAPFLIDPFTTEPQAGRFLLLFHQFLGCIHDVTGADPFWLIELSRWPATFLMMWALWRFLRMVLPHPESRARAIWLVAFSGGFDALVRPFAVLAPSPVSKWIGTDLWHLYGWSTFEAAFNPLWILGLAGILLVGTPLLQPGGPRTRRDLTTVVAGFPVLWFVHSYSALVLPALLAGVVTVDWIAEGRFPTSRAVRAALALLPGFAVVAAVSVWQLADPVFRAASGGVVGSQSPSVFWYPVTFGAVGILAILGWRHGDEASRPGLRVLAGWFVGGAWLASSPVLNGYHFVYILHLPLAVAGTHCLDGWVERARAGGDRRRIRRSLLALALFASPIVVTATSLAEVGEAQTVPTPVMELLDDLAVLPAGNVLAPPIVSILVPTFTPHRVWVGQWFLTPDFQTRSRVYDELTDDEADPARLSGIVAANSIRYLVAPARSAARMSSTLGDRVCSTKAYGPLVMLMLVDSRAAAGRGCDGTGEAGR